MALKITCPHCGTPRRLSQPYPPPGTELQCERCARTLAISYPKGMVQRLQGRGQSFEDPSLASPPPRPAPPRPPQADSQDAPTVVDGHAPPREVPPAPSPPRVAPPAESARPATGAPGPVHTWSGDLPVYDDEELRTEPAFEPPPLQAAPPRLPDPAPRQPASGPPRPRPPATPPPVAHTERRASRKPPPRERPKKKARPRRSIFWSLVKLAVAMLLLGGIAGLGIAVGAVWYYSQDLPTVEALGQYEPPTVTVIYDVKGRLLGEIYEKRRYVVPLDHIPDRVKNAFIAAEDANFWTHSGVDYEGIVRAIGRNAVKGKKAQGASTITMQVARNFLLSSEKTYERKLREVVLSRRIEDAFDKEHILYLYLNQIYLGSGAYGVEAAARTYFDKHVEDLTLAEAAIIAGLPQRPSDYSPHQHWEKARARQIYVLDQMRDKGYVTDAERTAALGESVNIAPRRDEFMQQAPYFTEHIRRYLVDTYGFDKIYNDGLSVNSTCDLDLQKVAQQAVIDGVELADDRVGYGGPASKLTEAEIGPWLDAQELVLRQEVADAHLRVGPEGTGGSDPLPARSTLEADRKYDAIVLEAAEKHVVVGIGSHKALIPLSWTTWAYPPNPDRSWKYRGLTALDGILARGDVVQVEVAGPSIEEFDNLKGYTAAGPGPLAAARLYEKPTLQGAFLSYRQSDGAVLAMVGGVDFENSEYNRATQARRQVGSTFKPIVYAAAIGTRQFSVGTMVQDAPTVFQTLGDKLWKPGNYGEEYLGNITLRRALQMSRNVCTVRVLDKIGLEPVFELAGPRLHIGYSEPKCSRTHISESAECEGTTTPSPVKGMVWCEACDATSCPLVHPGQQTMRDGPTTFNVGEPMSCLDSPTERGGQEWCHSCDVNLRVCDWLPIERIPQTDPCVDARLDDDGKTWCRSCDLSMGLGSSALTMVELARAYSAFATYGHLVEPHWIDRVVDRDGTVIEQWKAPEAWPQVMDPAVAGIAHWLLREVATGGTGAKSNRLGLHVAGKTGTTNDFIDAWFVGYNTELIAAAWVGYDQPRSMGYSFTGGDTALPIWMDYMKVAAPRSEDKDFSALPGVSYVGIDESTGRVAIGGRSVPMLPGTAPNNVAVEIGQKTTEDLITSDF